MNSYINLVANNHRLPGILLLLVCLSSLSIAFYVEHVKGIDPCILCLYQRLPYVAAGLFGFFAIIGKPGSFTQQMALLGCTIAFTIGAGLAVYHFGVEEKFWAAACSGVQDMNMSFDDLKASILAEPMKACDQKDWVIFGLSITVYNTIFSLFMAIFSFTSLQIVRKLKAHTL